MLGDERQYIYLFHGADRRYLSLAPELLGPFSPYPFAKIPISQNFRLSHQAVHFMNQVFPGGESYITSSKPGPKPIVLRCNPYKTYALAKALLILIKQHGASNVAIIAPSIRNNKPLQLLTNLLVERFKIPVEVPTDEESPLDDRVTRGKICISTIHQFKGRERHLVILLGIDSSFFDYFGRNIPDDKCPNEVFVALTRAVKQLVLVHDERRKPMPFVSVKVLYDTAEVVNITNGPKEIAPPNAPGRPLKLGLSLPPCVSVRDMARHIRDEPLHDITLSRRGSTKFGSTVRTKSADHYTTAYCYLESCLGDPLWDVMLMPVLTVAASTETPDDKVNLSTLNRPSPSLPT